MKCTGGPETCRRCARAGRQCIFEPASALPAPQSQSHFSSTFTQIPPTPHHISGPRQPLALSFEVETQTTQIPTARQQLPVKKRRIDDDLGSSTELPSPPISNCLSSETPYSAAQYLELHNNAEREAPISPPNAVITPTESQSSSSCKLTWLCEAGMQASEAEQMFHQFSLRIAPFIPALYDADFSKLPSSPIFGLACLQAMARYLPDSTKLRTMLWSQLRKYLQDVIFEMPDWTSLSSIETMQGLIILYSCCEATGPSVQPVGEPFGIDIVSARSIVEGYALKMGLGGWSDAVVQDDRFCVWRLWLYTMGH